MNLEVHTTISYGTPRAHSLAEKEPHGKKVLQYLMEMRSRCGRETKEKTQFCKKEGAIRNTEQKVSSASRP